MRTRLASKRATIGAFLGLGSPTVAELFANAGFDWLVIETEHNALDSAEIQSMLMAMNGTDAIPLVRVPNSSAVFTQRALDMGAMGVVIPMIKSADEARAVVRATRYPPEGGRSFGPLRASRYSFDNEEYLKHANQNILVVLIIETKEAAEDLDHIVRVPGVDALWIGTYDLCLSYGLNPIEQPHRQIDQIIERILALGDSAGIAVGQNAFSPNSIQERLAQGYRMIGFGPDYNLLATLLTQGIAAFKASQPSGARASRLSMSQARMARNKKGGRR